MLQVEFITSQTDLDIIVSFALAPRAHRSLTLIRSPQYEPFLSEERRGVTVGPLDCSDVAIDFLVSIRWKGTQVIVETQRYEYQLDVSGVTKNEIAKAKATLRKMTNDGIATVDGI